ncbi:MAG: AHH domain-containing protein [Gammaproteobacteria bacterium]|nr:AHH domain-containing protein [Gammaproteobacteria bacterium]
MEIKRRNELTLNDLGKIQTPFFVRSDLRNDFNGRGYGSGGDIHEFEEYYRKFETGSLFAVYFHRPSFPLFTWKKDIENPEKGKWVVTRPSIVENYNLWLEDILWRINFYIPYSTKKSTDYQDNDKPDIPYSDSPSVIPEKTYHEQAKNWSRKAGKTATNVLDDMFGDTAEKAKEAKGYYQEGNYSNMALVAGIATIDALNPLKKVKALEKAIETSDKLDNAQDALNGDVPSKGKNKKKISNSGGKEENKDKFKCDWKNCKGEHPKKIKYANNGSTSRGTYIGAWSTPWKNGTGTQSNKITISHYEAETSKAKSLEKAKSLFDSEQYVTNNHHLIPIAVMAKFPRLSHNAKLIGFNINDGEYGISLPYFITDIFRHDLQSHKTTHPNYSKKVVKMLQKIEKKCQVYCNKNNQKQLLNDLSELSELIREYVVQWDSLWLLRKTAVNDRKISFNQADIPHP